MKKLLLAICAVLLLACGKTDRNSPEDLIVGSWSFVRGETHSELYGDGTAMAEKLIRFENGVYYTTNTAWNYSISGKIVTLTQIGGDGKTLKWTIEKLTKEDFVYSNWAKSYTGERSEVVLYYTRVK